MSDRNLQEVLEEADSSVELLRNRGGGSFGFPVVPDEHTHWIEEQRAWAETCSFADQSHHMVDYWIEGPDALALFTELAVNSFEGFEPGQAKQLVLANPDGYLIGDGILFHLADQAFVLVGPPQAPNWVQYNVETGDYDVTTDRDATSGVRDGPPRNYRYQLQGPNAVQLMQDVTEDPLPDIPFFNFADVTIEGRSVRALRHGMAGEAGFEFWGPWEDAETVKESVLDAGERYGLRQLGAKSYGSSAVISGWVGMPLPAVYESEEMRGYREWLDARHIEYHYSIAGSLNSDDITDYYVTPVELGYDHIVDFDHGFVGKAALQQEIDDPDRKKVTLEWNADDLADVYASLFREGPTNKFVDLPVPWRSASHHDTVSKDGEAVGMSMWAAYMVNERELLSLAVVDVEYADPGTEVTLVWGSSDGSRNPAIERHEQTEIHATVAPVPYTEDRR